MAGDDRPKPASTAGFRGEVLSARNPRLATLRRLSGRRSARTDAGRFVIDGPRLVHEALDAGIVVDEVYVPADQVDVAAVVDLEHALRAANVVVHLVAPDVFRSVASTETPQPAIAVARPPVRDAAGLLASANALLAIKRIALQRRAKAKLEFMAPEVAGKKQLTLFLMCDSYMGCDQEFEVELDVKPGAAVEEEVEEEEGGGGDGDGAEAMDTE